MSMTSAGSSIMSGISTALPPTTRSLRLLPCGPPAWRSGGWAPRIPSLWAAFGRGRSADARALEAVRHPSSGYDVLYKGKGEVLRVTATREPGVRKISVDSAHNLITEQEIVAFPSSTTVTRWGATTDKVINLTFDDGPDPKYTPDDPGHPGAEGCEGDVLHRRLGRRREPRPAAAHLSRGARHRQSHLHASAT